MIKFIFRYHILPLMKLLKHIDYIKNGLYVHEIRFEIKELLVYYKNNRHKILN